MLKKDTNPKDAVASGKLPLHMVPSTLTIYAALAFGEGDSKYVAYNWRAAGVRASVYLSALERHVAKWKNGEWADAKTGVPHLASAVACLAIILDAHTSGTLTDDRPPAVDVNPLIAECEAILARVYAMNADIRPKGVEYTISTPCHESPA